jgi:Peptidase A4 family
MVLRARLATAFASVVGAALLNGPAGAAATAVYHSPIVAIDASQSSNWSGYNQGAAAVHHKFNSVSGTWVVPTATQHTAGEQEFSSTWIGIGGGCVNSSCSVTDGTLIQEGTEQDVAADGTPSYDAWWELIPAPEVKIQGFAVHPGDVISASITSAAQNIWTFKMTNTTTGQAFTKRTPYNSSHLTAEWITETPLIIGGNAGFAAMPNLGVVNMDLGTTNGVTPHLAPSQEVQLAPNGGIVATPSSPDPDTDGFNDCVWASSCAAPSGS